MKPKGIYKKRWEICTSPCRAFLVLSVGALLQAKRWPFRPTIPVFRPTDRAPVRCLGRSATDLKSTKNGGLQVEKRGKFAVPARREEEIPYQVGTFRHQKDLGFGVEPPRSGLREEEGPRGTCTSGVWGPRGAKSHRRRWSFSRRTGTFPPRSGEPKGPPERGEDADSNGTTFWYLFLQEFVGKSRGIPRDR